MPQQEMIFSDYLRVLIKHKVTIIIATVAVTLATYAWASRQKPEYSSIARIKIQRIQTFADMFDEFMVSSGDPLENYLHEITSRSVLSAAADLLKDTQHKVHPSTLVAVATASRVTATDLIDVTTLGPSAEASQAWCAAIVEAFINDHDEKITRNAEEEYRYIEEALTNKMAELRLINIKYGETLSKAGSSSVSYDQAKVLAERYTDAQINLDALRAEGNYTEQYPDIVALRETIKSVASRLKALSKQDVEVQTIANDTDQQKRVLEEIVAYLTKRREEARISKTIMHERVIRIEEPLLGSEVTTAKAYLTAVGALLGLMLGIILAFVAENLDTSIRTLVEIEETFQLPILGIIPHFSPNDENIPIRPEGFWNRLRYSDTVHTISIFWRALHSTMGSKKSSASSSSSKVGMLIVPFSPRSPATEGYRAIRTNLQLGADDDRMPPMIITSAGPAEGKSTTIANLAFAFAQAGKRTLLVGANMRRPSLYRTFGLTREKGLSEILVGDLSWIDAIKDNRDLALGEKADDGLGTAPGTENLFIITCGGRTIQPAEWLSFPMFGSVVHEWSEEFDVVLVDGPPVLPVPDSVIMSAAVGHTVLVYQAGSTQRDSMLRAISLVQKSGATVAGLVLNDLRATWGSSPDYFHYRGYYGRPEK